MADGSWGERPSLCPFWSAQTRLRFSPGATCRAGPRRCRATALQNTPCPVITRAFGKHQPGHRCHPIVVTSSLRLDSWRMALPAFSGDATIILMKISRISVKLLSEAGF